tara:strand:- start:431 stop:559 length:129 start_codon:yes stop_codon:yes gene_type:complete
MKQGKQHVKRNVEKKGIGKKKEDGEERGGGLEQYVNQFVRII